MHKLGLDVYLCDHIFSFITSVPWNLRYQTSSFKGSLSSEGVIETNLSTEEEKFLLKEVEFLRTEDLKS